MRDLRRLMVGGALATLCAVTVSAPSWAGGPATVDPNDSVPTTEAPSDTSAPPAESTPTDTLVGAGEPDSDIDGTVAAVAIIGFLALLGVASWWMVRRSNPDGDPMPPPPSGPPPSDLV